MRNLTAKVSADPWPEFKARVTACYQAPSRAIARQLAAGIRADYANVLPSALACFEDDFEACIAHLRLPVTHRRFARTTNLLERLFVEERRRLKNHSQWLRREAGAQADVRRPHPSRRTMAWSALLRVRAPTDRSCQKRTRRRISRFNHAAGPVSPAPSFQQIQALTHSNRRLISSIDEVCGMAWASTSTCKRCVRRPSRARRGLGLPRPWDRRKQGRRDT